MFRKFATVIAVFFIYAATALAQLPTAELHSIYPPVIQSGKTTEVALTGVNLDEVRELHFSDLDVVVKPVLKPASEYQINPQPVGLRLLVTVPKLEKRKAVTVRAAGYYGLSTSRPVVILAADDNSISDSAGAAHHKMETAPELPINTKAFGTTDARKTDWWKVAVKKGQRVLVHCEAERIDSQADPSLTMVDSRGFELEQNRDAIGRDPMIDFTAQKDGTYWVGVHDVFYNGGPNFPYLLEVSTRPWIDAIQPSAGKAGEIFDATLIGRNLPGGSLGENLDIDGKAIETLKVKIPVPGNPDERIYSSSNPAAALLPVFSYQYKNSNVVNIGISDQPVMIPSQAETLSPPFEVGSRFDFHGEVKKFRFRAKNGTSYWVEVIADRIMGHIDPYLVIEKITKDKDGKENFKIVKEGDDMANKAGLTFNLSSRDIEVNFTADQDGDYQISLNNQYTSSGPEKVFRIAVREASPDFGVVAIAERAYLDQRQAYPSSVLLRKEGTFPVRLIVDRKHGLVSPVTITASGLPPGVTCPPVTLSEKESSGRLVFSASKEASLWNGNVKVIASVKEGDKLIEHPVHLGTLVIGVPDYNTGRLRSRLDTGFPLSVSVNEPTPARIEVGDSRKFTVSLGKKLEIPITLPSKHEIKGNIAITPVGLPGMRKPPIVNIAEKAVDGKITIDFTPNKNVFNPTEGVWNFVLKGTGVTKYKRNPQSVDRAKSEKEHIETLATKYTELSARAKTDQASTKTALDVALKNLSTASAAAKPDLEKSVVDARLAYENAQKSYKSAEAKRLESEKEKAGAVKRLAAATRASAAKDVKFVTWSMPLSVEVIPAPEKPKK